MNESPAPGPENVHDISNVEDLDLSRNDELTETLLDHHRTDYQGMSDTEKTGFINHLKGIAETDRTPEMRAAAKRFLMEIEEGGK